jgi:uncharacterized membrane protein YdjX (TVP38/TMEM64 family)
MPTPRHPFLRCLRIAIAVAWVAVIGAGVYLFLFHRAETQTELSRAMSVSWWMAWGIYLVLTVLRGIILMPAAPLVLLGTAFLPPLPLFGLTLIGVMASTSVIYWFPTSLHLEDLFRSRHGAAVDRLRGLLLRQQLAVIAGWSFLPMTPTVLIIYVCGLLKVDFKKTLLGVAIGSGANSALYIFLGDYLMRLAGWKF